MAEEAKEKEGEDVDGGDDAVDEELDNKDLPEDELGGEDQEKAKPKGEDDEEYKRVLTLH
jgi:hypothetical protein